MLLRSAFVICCLCSAMSAAVFAQPPAAVLSIRSIDSLLSDAKFLDDETGEDFFKWSVDSLISSYTKQQGLAGIDQTKPLGAYWNVSATTVEQPVIFVPVADSEKLMGLFAKVAADFKVTDGVWRMTLGGTKQYAKIDRGYCFLSADLALLLDLAEPAKIVNTQYDLAFDINFASINPTFAEGFTNAMQKGRPAALRAMPPSSSAAQATGRMLGYDATIATFTSCTKEGERLSLGVDLNQKTRLGVVELLLTGKPGSGLAAAMTSVTKTKPLFAEIGPQDTAARLVFSLPMAGLSDPFAQVVKAISEESQRNLDRLNRGKSDLDKTNEKLVMQGIFKIAEAAMKEEFIHLGIALQANSDGTVCVIGGAHVSRDDDVTQLVDEVAAMRVEDTTAAMKIDVAKYAGARIHAIPSNQLDAAVKLYGSDPVHIAHGGNRVWLSIGKNNLEVLREALDKPATPSPAASPISVQMKPAQLFAAFEKNEPIAVKRAKAMTGQPGDKLNLTVVPEPNGAKVRVELGLDLLNLDPRKAE